MKTLHDLFLNELADISDAKSRCIPTLEMLGRAAASVSVRRALDAHVERGATHLSALDEVFRQFGVSARSRTCEATVGLLREIHEILGEFRGSPAIDAAVISASKKVGHYAIVTYGCLATWAETLGHIDAARILDELLQDERMFDTHLSLLARQRSNQRALGEKHMERASGLRASTRVKTHGR